MDGLPLHLIAAHLNPKDAASLAQTCSVTRSLLPGDDLMFIADMRLRAQHADLCDILRAANLSTENIAKHSHVSLNSLFEFVSFKRNKPRSHYKARAARLAKALVVRDVQCVRDEDPTVRARTLRILLCVIIQTIRTDDPQLLCMRPWATLAFLNYVSSSVPYIQDSLTLGFVLGVRHVCIEVMENKAAYRSWMDRSSYETLIDRVYNILLEFMQVQVTMHFF